MAAKTKIFWTQEEKETMLAAMQEVWRRHPFRSMQEIAYMAQQEALPPERHRPTCCLHGSGLGYELTKRFRQDVTKSLAEQAALYTRQQTENARLAEHIQRQQVEIERLASLVSVQERKLQRAQKQRGQLRTVARKLRAEQQKLPQQVLPAEKLQNAAAKAVELSQQLFAVDELLSTCRNKLAESFDAFVALDEDLGELATAATVATVPQLPTNGNGKPSGKVAVLYGIGAAFQTVLAETGLFAELLTHDCQKFRSTKADFAVVSGFACPNFIKQARATYGSHMYLVPKLQTVPDTLEAVRRKLT
jgi:hypothetical protein